MSEIYPTRLNRLLRPLNLRLHRIRTVAWDDRFREWEREFKRTGRDPNDIGDDEWGPDELERGWREVYLPLLDEPNDVLELGPGSGRLTRRILERARTVTTIDSSPAVCKWLRRYFADNPKLSVVRIDSPRFPSIDTGSKDVVLAHGVLEHLDLDEIYWFLVEFRRVLRAGGRVAFNYNDVASDDAVRLIPEFGGPEQRCVFRLQHSEGLEQIAAAAGFACTDVLRTGDRVSFMVLQAA